MDARNFFMTRREMLKRNQFGGTLRAPLEIPHLYNGRNRTFIFLSYEAQRAHEGVVSNDVVPTSAMLNGDFSGAGEPVIYDLLTSRPAAAGSATVRDPFSDNKIPANRMAPQSQYFDKYQPAPNLTAT